MSSRFNARRAFCFYSFMASRASLFLLAALLLSLRAKPLSAQQNAASTRVSETDLFKRVSEKLNRQDAKTPRRNNGWRDASTRRVSSSQKSWRPGVLAIQFVQAPSQDVGSNVASGNAQNTAASTRELPQNSARIAPLENPEVVKALLESGVYVEPSMRLMAPPQRIATLLSNVPKNGLAVAVLVMPASWLGTQSADGYAMQLRRFMKAKDGVAIVVAGREVAFAGVDVDDATRDDIVKNAARTFDSESYAAGIAQIAANVAARRGAENAARDQFFGVAIGALCGAAYWLWRRRRRGAQRALCQARQRVHEALKNLTPRCEKLGADYEYSLLGEDDETRRALLQSHQGRFFEALSRAHRRSESAQTLADWKIAESESANATREYSRARNVLQGLPETHERKSAAALKVVEVPPLGSDLAGARAGYALDFFTSQPVARAEMAPVDLTMNGARRRVWAARETASRVLADVPHIAVLDYGHQKRAWFDVPHFNPWTADESALETLPMSEIAAAMAAQNQFLGGGYIGFGRGEKGWFAADYSGWDGGPHAPREYSQPHENVETSDANAADERAATPHKIVVAEEKNVAPREPFEAKARALDAS